MKKLWMLSMCIGFALASSMASAQEYDILLKGGHVIDAKNGIDALMDVAIEDGKIAKVAKAIPTAMAVKTVNVAGMYVVPGLIDVHEHLYVGEGDQRCLLVFCQRAVLGWARS